RAGHAYDAVVVTNYLWRERLADIAAAVGAGGVLIYETFAIGNELLGKPSNPLFLLRRGELLDLARASGLTVLGFESGRVDLPRPAIIERICAWRATASATPPAID
ncbi:MAG: SAM-dependent methyltransferase, partial [Burkholderiales bacterium]